MVVLPCTIALFLQAWVAQARLTAETPQVRLDGASLFGLTDGSVESFLGIPFAEPPVGDLRLRLPQLVSEYKGTINATSYGNQCIQQGATVSSDIPAEVLESLAAIAEPFSPNPDVPQSEDCLYINVIRPANLIGSEKLPILFWIYGGGFTGGSNSMSLYNGTAIVQRSIELGEPVIWVAVNYRLTVFGFLGGREIKEAGLGNLGLQDQRTGLHWVQKHISAFGGDPQKVTIWGESAGSISVFLQMAANGGDSGGLFRGGIMSSGSSLHTRDITDSDVQGNYDFVVEQVGCANATDTLACLRTVPTDALLAAANNTLSGNGFQSLANSYMPHADGVFLTRPPHQLVDSGTMAHFPFIIGDVQDEGTLFSFGNFNITTEPELVTYLQTFWFPGASSTDIQTLLDHYPADPAAGSPFDTGEEDAYTPEYKRIAAITGDFFFHAPRRQVLDKFSLTQPAYNFLSVREGFTGIGYAHGTDLFNAFGPGDITDYFIHFVVNQDPNRAGTQVHWPRFDPLKRLSLQFNDGDTPLNVTADTERLSGTRTITDLGQRFPF